MAARGMTTRRSARNLLLAPQVDPLVYDTPQDIGQPQPYDSDSLTDDDTCRDYMLNYEKAMRKKAKACKAEYLIKSEIKGENHIFSFSAAMYELYRNRLAEHFRILNDNPSVSIKVRFKDSADKSGNVVESLLKVYHITPGGYDKLKYTISLYHTNTRIMVNGRQAALFNIEHSKITESIMASEQVSVLDQELYECIAESLKNLIVESSAQNQTQKSARNDIPEPELQRNSAIRRKPELLPARVNTEGICGASSPNTYETEELKEDFWMCPICRLTVDEGICCETCERWFHFECEQISITDQNIYENTDLIYTCLACGYNQKCDGLDESLANENRNFHESDPIISISIADPDNISEGADETVRKVPHERNQTHSHSDMHFSSTPTQTNGSPRGIISAQCANQMPPEGPGTTFQGTSGMQPKPSLDDNVKTAEGLPIPNPDTNTMPNRVKPAEVQAAPAPEQAQKQNRGQRRGCKQKVKESEQEQQLILAKSVINNLERQKNELENSNKLLKQEINLFKSEVPQKENRNPTEQRLNVSTVVPQIHPAIPATEQYDHHKELNLLRKQLENIEMELMKSRISNLETCIQQQRQMCTWQLHQYPPMPMHYPSHYNPFQVHPSVQPYLIPQMNPFMTHHQQMNMPLPYPIHQGMAPHLSTNYGHIPNIGGIAFANGMNRPVIPPAAAVPRPMHPTTAHNIDYRHGPPLVARSSRQPFTQRATQCSRNIQPAAEDGNPMVNVQGKTHLAPTDSRTPVMEQPLLTSKQEASKPASPYRAAVPKSPDGRTPVTGTMEKESKECIILDDFVDGQSA